MSFPSQSPLQSLASLLLLSPSLPVPALFADPAAGLGEALIHYRAPCQLCQKSETERGTQLWNKPLHDPV